MRDKIQVIRNNELESTTWRFSYADDGKLYLYQYNFGIRPTKRSQPRTKFWYERCDGRHNTIKLDDIPIPDDVKAEAIQQVVSKLEVLKS